MEIQGAGQTSQGSWPAASEGIWAGKEVFGDVEPKFVSDVKYYSTTRVVYLAESNPSTSSIHTS